MSTVAVGWPPMLAHPFMQHAFLAGTAVALAAGLVGYFLVLRAQVFTADALSHVAFTGALAALAAGVDARIGLFAVTVVVALAMGGLSPRARPDDVVIGGLFAWILGLGVFFLSIYTTHPQRQRATARPASPSCSDRSSASPRQRAVDHRAHRGRRHRGRCCCSPVRCCSPASTRTSPAPAGYRYECSGFGFLAIVGVTAAEASQVVGALLILGLLAAPAGAAIRLTSRPLRRVRHSPPPSRSPACGSD